MHPNALTASLPCALQLCAQVLALDNASLGVPWALVQPLTLALMHLHQVHGRGAARVFRMALRAELVAKWLLDRCLRASPATPDVAALRARRTVLSAWQSTLVRAARRDKLSGGLPMLSVVTVMPGRLPLIGEPVVALADPFSRDLLNTWSNSTPAAEALPAAVTPLPSPLSSSTLGFSAIPATLRIIEAFAASAVVLPALAAELLALAQRVGFAQTLAAALAKCSAPASAALLAPKHSEAAIVPEKSAAAGASKLTSTSKPAAKSGAPSAPVSTAAAATAADVSTPSVMALKPDLVLACLWVVQWQLAGIISGSASAASALPPVAAAPTMPNSRAASSASSTATPIPAAPVNPVAEVTQRILQLRRSLAPSCAEACKSFSAETQRALQDLSSKARCWGFSDDAQVGAALTLFPPDGSDVGKC